jgi:MFS transporter, PPP family, 3-phenylpropionic acid transporter
VVHGYVPILIIGVAFLLANGTMLPLIETVAVRGVRSEGLDYGRMRLWGSITFIIANFVGGLAIEALGGGVALWLIGLGTVLTIVAARALPSPSAAPSPPSIAAGWRTSLPARLLGSRLFVLFMVAIGCTHGAHATFYTFGALHWQAQGLSAAWVGTLWAIGVIAEVALFAFSAPVVRRLTPTQLIVTGAGASVLRWGIMAFDPPLAVLIPLQVVHALTYGAAHLGAILFIARAVPHRGMGSAQAFYATMAGGLVLGVVGLLSGALYTQLGGGVYAVPALVSLVGCIAGIALLRGWSGGPLWAEDAGPVRGR